MINKKSGKFIYILFFFLLLIFEFFSMQTLVLEEGSYYAQIVYLLAFVISVGLIISTGYIPSNYLVKLFAFWGFYIILRFLTSTSGHDSSVAFFRYTWFCNCFLITYITGKTVENREKIMIFFMLLLLLIASFYVYQNLLVTSFGYIDLDSIKKQTNIIFWSFCALPFVFLINDRTWQLVIISVETVLVLITMKRSALIALAFILVLFVVSIFTKNANISKKKQIVSMVWTIALAVVLFSQFSDRFSNLFDNNMARIEQMEDDGGSGRVDIWNDAIKGLSESNPLEIIFGHGVASTMDTIQHTSCHNDFLTILLECGIIGVVFYLLFIIYVLKRVFYTRKRDRQLFYCYSTLSIIMLVIGNVGDLFTCYTYLGFMMVILAVLEIRIEQSSIRNSLTNVVR